MPNFSSVDPFSQVYQALWAALFDPAAGLADLVDAENRIDFSAASPAPRDNVECRHLPEVMLAQADWSASPGNSRAKQSTQAYSLRMATSSFSVPVVNQLKWKAWRALELAGDRLGLDFVESWVIRTAGDSVILSTENRGDEKWVTLITIVVTMKIDRTLLVD